MTSYFHTKLCKNNVSKENETTHNHLFIANYVILLFLLWNINKLIYWSEITKKVQHSLFLDILNESYATLKCIEIGLKLKLHAFLYC